MAAVARISGPAVTSMSAHGWPAPGDAHDLASDGNNQPRKVARYRWAARACVAALLLIVLGFGAVWRWGYDPSALAEGSPSPDVSREGVAGLSEAPRLSLVVLRFENLGEPSDDHLADGITSDLISDLSHLRGALVIARASAYAYRGKKIEIRQIGAELGVRYALKGSIRRLGPALRVNVQLVSAETGANLWSDRFDQAVATLSEGQDQIITRLRNGLRLGLTDIEAMRSVRERPVNPDAFDLILQARAVRFQPTTRARLMEVLRLCELAVAQDPSAVTALAMAAEALTSLHLDYEVPDTLDRAEQLLERARSLEPNSQIVLAIHTFLMRTKGHWIAAREEALRLIDAFPNLVDGYNTLGIVRMREGRFEEALSHHEATIRLDPRGPGAAYRNGRIAYALVLLGRDTEAIDWSERALSIAPDDLPASVRGRLFLIQAAAHARAGDLVAAGRAAVTAQTCWPFVTVRTRYPDTPTSPNNQTEVRRFHDALRLAGVRDYADPDADFGVGSDDRLRSDLTGPTPTRVPGAVTVRTDEVLALLRSLNPLVIDARQYYGGGSIPGAVGLPYGGQGGEMNGAVQQRLEDKMLQLTKGDRSVPIVTFGWNSERFDGRNMALRLAALGYTQIYWYRGGKEAWEVAVLPETELATQEW